MKTLSYYALMKIVILLLAGLWVFSGCTFFVPVDPLEPAVTTGELTNVQVNQVTFNGAVSDPDYRNDRQMKKSGVITGFGFVYGTRPNPSLDSGTVLRTIDSTASYQKFQYTVRGLRPGVVYYVRAFASNEGGATGYGQEVQFLTKEPEIYASKSFTMYAANAYDMDLGNLTYSNSGTEDLAWRYPGVAIYPLRSARFSIVASTVKFENIKYADLIKYTYSTAIIDADPAKGNKIPTGTILAYITSEGRYGKMRIDEYKTDMWVTILTYQKP